MFQAYSRFPQPRCIPAKDSLEPDSVFDALNISLVAAEASPDRGSGTLGAWIGRLLPKKASEILMRRLG